MNNYTKSILTLFIIIIIIIIIVLNIELYCFLNKKSFHEVIDSKVYNKLELLEIENNNSVNLKDYEKGYQIMKKSKIVIGGLFKDSSKKFDLFKKRMNNLSKYFKDLQIVIFENDSSDNSRILLLDWEKKQSNVHIIKLVDNEFCLLKNNSAVSYGALSNKRMMLMAQYRNYVKEYTDLYFNDYDYFSIIDTDAAGPININGLAHSFSVQSTLNWDMISANGRTGLLFTSGELKYYDLLALYNYDKSKEENSLNISKLVLYLDSIGNDPIKVDNAFGGFAIYKMSSIKNINYTPHDGKYICEHTIFTNNMKLNGHPNFYINPKLTFLVGKQGPDKFGGY